ncbi:BTAD domain-containing putative transcriptional regulator [Streptomyces sp. NPDC048282]|uniref:BTAD domain-containing putative transcriptional regulator n=1 Tax=Streptomyces sp. NPDC048282 TaxID=3365528 RepID=UPI003721B723
MAEVFERAILDQASAMSPTPTTAGRTTDREEGNHPAAWELRVFGSLTALRAGQALPLGPLRHRALLGLLLVRLGNVVAVGQLVDELWGPRPPRHPVATLQTYVSHLRRALEKAREQGGAHARLRHLSPGYVLDLDPELVDAHRFERLIEQGRQFLADGRFDQARDALTRALGLWRAQPYLELVSYRPIADENERLGQLRLTALEAQADACLALGDADRVVRALYPEVQHNPTHERLVGHLMTGLYRVGRQAEALRLYEQTRRHLAEELGVDPGAELQGVHTDILHQRLTLPEPPKRPRPATADTPGAAERGAGEPAGRVPGSARPVSPGVADGGGPTGSAHVRERPTPDNPTPATGTRTPTDTRTPTATSTPTPSHTPTAAPTPAVPHTPTAAPIPADANPHAAAPESAASHPQTPPPSSHASSAPGGPPPAPVSNEPIAHMPASEVPASDASPAYTPPTHTAVTPHAPAAPHPPAIGHSPTPSPTPSRPPASPPAPGTGPSPALPPSPTLPTLPQHAPAAAGPVSPTPAAGALGDFPRVRGLFVGRGRERGVLGGHVVDALNGGSHLTAVLGEMGVGKTELVAEVGAHLNDLLQEVVWGCCTSWDGVPDYWVWSQVFRQLAVSRPEPFRRAEARFGRLLAPLMLDPEAVGRFLAAEEQPPLARFLVQDAMCETLLALAAEEPLVVVLEDLDQADERSLELLTLLRSRLRGEPLGVVVIAEDTGVAADFMHGGAVTDVLSDPRTRSLRLTGLSRAETAELVAVQTGIQVPDDVLRVLHERSRGNPYFLHQFLAGVGDPEPLQDRTAVQAALADVPLGVRQALGRRLAALPEPVLEVLRCCSALGAAFDLALVQEAVPRGSDPEAALEEAVRCGLLRRETWSPFRLAFRDALTQEVLLTELSGTDRTRLRKRAVRAVQEQQGSHGTGRGPRRPLSHRTPPASPNGATGPRRA